MGRSVFISHAAADKALIEAFVRFLEDGIGLPEDEIFCISIPGMGIPAGKTFVNFIREEMEKPALVIMMITPNYLASRFCQGEMGAAWIKGHRIYPIIVSPATFADMDGVFLGTQAVKIEDDVRVNELKEALAAAVNFKPKSASRWDLARKEFFERLPKIMAALPKPATVSLQAHTELQSKYDDALNEMGGQSSEIRRLKQQVAALEAVKDAAEVASVAASFANTSVTDEFQQLLRSVKVALKKVGSKAVRMHILAKFNGKPFDGWRDDPDAFDEAIRRNLLDSDLDLKEDAPDIKQVLDALKVVDKFIRDHEDDLYAFAEAEFDAPLETDNEDFWREHFL